MRNRLLLISIIVNVLLLTGIIMSLIGKGIQINPIYKSYTHYHQEQFQGQLSMNLWIAQGNSIIWTSKSFEKPENAITFLMTLPPEISYFHRLILNKKIWILYYPSFVNKK